MLELQKEGNMNNPNTTGGLVLAGHRHPRALDDIRRFCGLEWSGGGPEIWAFRYYEATIGDTEAEREHLDQITDFADVADKGAAPKAAVPRTADRPPRGRSLPADHRPTQTNRGLAGPGQGAGDGPRLERRSPGRDSCATLQCTRFRRQPAAIVRYRDLDRGTIMTSVGIPSVSVAQGLGALAIHSQLSLSKYMDAEPLADVQFLSLALDNGLRCSGA